jgi:hypothetical protein
MRSPRQALQPDAGADIGADRRRWQAEQPRAVERVAQRLADAAEASNTNRVEVAPAD